jgi:hypothetical protein
MKIIAPTLNKELDATPEIIAEVIPLLNGKDNPFAILQQTELTYMQTLWTPNGYDIEYQEQNVMHHYQLKKLINEQKAISIFQSYLLGEDDWKLEFEFMKKNIANLPTKIGFFLGNILGSFFRGIKEGKEKRNSNKSVSPNG